MSAPQSHSGTWFIVLTFCIGMLLTVFPLPDWFDAVRPQWCALFLLYWCFALPDRVGVLTAGAVGLLLDVLTGTLLGQHALGLAVISFLACHLHRQIRIVPLWQQALTATALLIINQLLFSWIRGIIGYSYFAWSDWASVIATGFICPLIFTALRRCRTQFRVR